MTTRHLNVRQAAAVLGVHPNTVRRMADDGRLPCYQLPGSGYRRFLRKDVELARQARTPNYHDLHITTDEIPRTSILDLPYGVEVTCTRVTGWQVRDHNQKVPPPARLPNLPPDPKLIGGEYDSDPETGKGGLRLDVAGHIICDSLTATHVPVRQALTSALRPEMVTLEVDPLHDERCEAEWVEGAGLWTGCDCAQRVPVSSGGD